MMEESGWNLTFNYNGHGIVCSISLTGNTQAIQLGLGLALAAIQDKFLELRTNRDAAVELIPELLIFDEVRQGNIKPFNGKFLQITRLKTVPNGLVSSVSIEWQ